MIDLDDMIWLLIDAVYDMKKKGLDYGEEFEVLLELDEELKDYYVNNNKRMGLKKRRKKGIQ